MAIFRKGPRLNYSVNIPALERKERLAFEDNAIPSTHTSSKEEIEKSKIIQQGGGFYSKSRTGKTYHEYYESPEIRSIVAFDEYMANRYTQEQSGPVLVKKKTPPTNTGNK